MSELLEPVIFFTDRDLGKTFPSILKQANILVETHSDHFADDTNDEDWLIEVGRKGWYVLTRDKQIRYREIERMAVENANVGLFVLVGKAPHTELAQNFVLTKHKIERFIRKTSRPFIAKISRPPPRKAIALNQRSGNVEIIWP